MPSPASSTTASGLSGAVRGPLWMLSFCFFLSSQAIFIRHLAADLHPFEIVFFRNVFGIAFLMPLLWQVGLAAMRITRYKMYALATLFAATGPFFWYWSVAMMPMADMIALTFLSPVFSSIVAIFLFREGFDPRRLGAIAIGFIGAMIILRPGIAVISAPAWIALIATFCIASGALTLRALSRTDSSDVIVLWTAAFAVPISAVPAAFVWTGPSLESIGWLVGVALAAMLAQISWVRSLAAAPVSAVMPFNFAKLPIAAFFGFVFFAEEPDHYTWIGAAVIFAATLYIGQYEARAAQARRALSDAD